MTQLIHTSQGIVNLAHLSNARWTSDGQAHNLTMIVSQTEASRRVVLAGAEAKAMYLWLKNACLFDSEAATEVKNER